MEKINRDDRPQDPFDMDIEDIIIPDENKPVVAFILAEMAKKGLIHDRRTNKPLSLRKVSNLFKEKLAFSIDNQSKLRRISDAAFNYEIGPRLIQFADDLALRVDEIWAKRAQKHYIDKIR